MNIDITNHTMRVDDKDGALRKTIFTQHSELACQLPVRPKIT
jgi:hypothetical protein